MKDLLSNEEIDTLLEMFRSEDAPIAEEGAIEEVVAEDEHETIVSRVDLLKPNRLSREQMRDLERIFHGSAKQLGAVITDKLRFDMQSDCVAVEQIRFQNWLTMIGHSNCIYILHVPNLDGPVLCSMTTNLLYGAVDRILGGLGKVTEVPKDFTEAEYVVADAFMDPCIERLAASMEEVLPVGWKMGSRFTNPSLAQILPLQDVVLSVHFQVGGDFLLGDLRLVIPYNAIEPHLGSLGRGRVQSEEDTSATRAQLSRSVMPVPVDFSVHLGETSLALRQLLSLKVGDVVPLQTRLGDPLVAPVEGVPKFRGQVGTLGKRLAYQVAAVME